MFGVAEVVGAERAGVVCFVQAKRAREEISEETWASSSGSLRYFKKILYFSNVLIRGY